MEQTYPTAHQPHTMKKPNKIPRLYLGILGVAALFAAAGLLYLLNVYQLSTVAAESLPMPSSPEIEEKWGIRISQVAETADGGMVDFRYVVLDPTKAENVGVDASSTPLLIPENNQAVIFQTAQMPHKETINAGVTYFMLYDNAGGAIRAHSFVTIQLGELKLAHVPVR